MFGSRYEASEYSVLFERSLHFEFISSMSFLIIFSMSWFVSDFFLSTMYASIKINWATNCYLGYQGSLIIHFEDRNKFWSASLYTHFYFFLYPYWDIQVKLLVESMDERIETQPRINRNQMNFTKWTLVTNMYAHSLNLSSWFKMCQIIIV